MPPVAVVALVEFAKSGYLLSYLPGAVIALLLAPAALMRSRPGHRHGGPGLGRGGHTGRARRRRVRCGPLPVRGRRAARAHQPGMHGLWLTQARYQAPYPQTRAFIRSVDRIDAQLARLGRLVRPGADVLVIDSVDGGVAFYRQAGTALPGRDIVLVSPGTTDYTEHGGSLDYADPGRYPWPRVARST